MDRKLLACYTGPSGGASGMEIDIAYGDLVRGEVMQLSISEFDSDEFVRMLNATEVTEALIEARRRLQMLISELDSDEYARVLNSTESTEVTGVLIKARRRHQRPMQALLQNTKIITTVGPMQG